LQQNIVYLVTKIAEWDIQIEWDLQDWQQGES
jgi:hypothetical protein